MALLEAQEKQLLLGRYLDIEWPGDATDLRCVRCQRVAISHYMSNCKHIFCNNCRRVFSDGGRWRCPQCQEYVTKVDDQDFDVEFQLHQLRIFCPNKKYGCKYEDQLRNIPKHLVTCRDTLEAALPKEYTGPIIKDDIGATAKVVNSNGELEEEIRDVKVKVVEKFKEMESKFDEQMKMIDDVDSKFNVLAGRVNGIEQKSEDQFQSLKTLLQSVIQRIQLIELHHQQTMNQMFLNMEEMRTKVASMTQEMETLQIKKSEELNSPTTESYEWVLKNVDKSIRKDKPGIESEVFKIAGYKHEIKARLPKHDGKLIIYLQFKDGETTNKFLNQNRFTTVKYIVRDQSDALQKKDIIRESYLRLFDCFGHYNWILGCWLPDAMLAPPYTRKDCLKITMLFEPPSIDRSFISDNGILMWTVDDYKTRKQELLYNDVWSPTFYTSPQGYRVITRLLINYSKWMEIEVWFLTGEHDHSLSINFPHKTTVTLINQLDPSKNLVKSEQREDVRLYVIPLETSKLIEQNGFIKNDSLLLKVVIEPV